MSCQTTFSTSMDDQLSGSFTPKPIQQTMNDETPESKPYFNELRRCQSPFSFPYENIMGDPPIDNQEGSQVNFILQSVRQMSRNYSEEISSGGQLPSIINSELLELLPAALINSLHEHQGNSTVVGHRNKKQTVKSSITDEQLQVIDETAEENNYETVHETDDEFNLLVATAAAAASAYINTLLQTEDDSRQTTQDSASSVLDDLSGLTSIKLDEVKQVNNRSYYETSPTTTGNDSMISDRFNYSTPLQSTQSTGRFWDRSLTHRPNVAPVVGSSPLGQKIEESDSRNNYEENYDRSSLYPSLSQPSSDELKYKNPSYHTNSLLFSKGVGGRNFCPPIVLAHPEEFKNPSSFLKVYGDPLCGTEGGNIENTVKYHLTMNGKNGNWSCNKCQNVNYPRRFKCNKCFELRDMVGDRLVSEYALHVYHQHLKYYKKLGGNENYSDNTQQNYKTKLMSQRRSIGGVSPDEGVNYNSNIGETHKRYETYETKKCCNPPLRKFNKSMEQFWEKDEKVMDEFMNLLDKEYQSPMMQLTGNQIGTPAKVYQEKGKRKDIYADRLKFPDLEFQRCRSTYNSNNDY